MELQFLAKTITTTIMNIATTTVVEQKEEKVLRKGNVMITTMINKLLLMNNGSTDIINSTLIEEGDYLSEAIRIEGHVIQTIGIISMICSFILILFILINNFKKKCKIENQLILCQSISGLFLGIGYGFGPTPFYNSTTLCFIQALFISYFEIATFLWSACIITSIVLVLLRFSKKKKIIAFIIYNLISWIIPLIIVIVEITQNVYGPDGGGWCEIDNKNEDRKYWIVFTEFIILWLVTIYIILSILFIFIFIKYYHYKLNNKLIYVNIKKTIIRNNRNILMKFICYPIILILLFIPSTIRFVIERINQNQSPLYLIYIDGILTHSLGILNVLFYGFTQNIFTSCLHNKIRTYTYIDQSIETMKSSFYSLSNSFNNQTTILNSLLSDSGIDNNDNDGFIKVNEEEEDNSSERSDEAWIENRYGYPFIEIITNEYKEYFGKDTIIDINNEEGGSMNINSDGNDNNGEEFELQTNYVLQK
ncbi:hypothetical protein ABK040_005596 [Willaertia magna]